MDGIGNHPSDYESIGSLGSNSWTSAADGLVCATLYPFKQQEVINSVRAYLQSSSVAQSEVILYILDSLSFTNGLFSGYGTMIYSDKISYSGTFNNGLYQGYGVYKEGSKVYSGQWYKGKLIVDFKGINSTN